MNTLQDLNLENCLKLVKFSFTERFILTCRDLQGAESCLLCSDCPAGQRTRGLVLSTLWTPVSRCRGAEPLDGWRKQDLGDCAC